MTFLSITGLDAAVDDSLEIIALKCQLTFNLRMA